MGAGSSGDSKYKIVELNNENVLDYMGTWYEITVKAQLTKKGKIEECCEGAIACYDDYVSESVWNNEIKPQIISKNPNITPEELNKLLSEEYNKIIKKFTISNYCIFKTKEKLDWRCQLGQGEKINDQYARFLVTFNKQMFDVAFQNFLRFLGGDYLIVELNSPLDPINGYTVVYGGTNEYFWILSRNPEFSKLAKFQELKETYKDDLKDSIIRNPDVYKDFINRQVKTECKTNLEIRE